jgi:hypothetical protein
MNWTPAISIFPRTGSILLHPEPPSPACPGLVGVTSHSPVLSFHVVTNCKFSISFLLTFIQNAGGVGDTFSPFGVQLRTLYPGCIFGTCGRSNVRTFRRCYLSCFHPLPHSFAFFCTFLHSPKIQLFCFQAIPHSFAKTPGGIDIHERVPKNGFSFYALRHSHRPQ